MRHQNPGQTGDSAWAALPLRMAAGCAVLLSEDFWWGCSQIELEPRSSWMNLYSHVWHLGLENSNSWSFPQGLFSMGARGYPEIFFLLNGLWFRVVFRIVVFRVVSGLQENWAESREFSNTTHSLPHCQHPAPERCYNWWAHRDVVLPPEVLLCTRVHSCWFTGYRFGQM